MNPAEQTCDTYRIDQYLDEDLNETEREEFEAHLSTCEFCRIELQRRAADPELWQAAAQLLGDPVSGSTGSLEAELNDAQQQRYATGVLEMLAPTDDPRMLGRIGEYEVSGVVGVGGMGAVLKGFDRSLRRVVAIKVMAPHLAGSGSARARFQREARAAAAITHDNVIATYGVSEANGLPYLVMPFARGPSLQKRIDESGPLTSVEVVRIGRQIAAGLAAAHEQGLVHRDIKPANILLNEGIERLWITDFGVARAMDDASMTRTGVIAGTPQYMSPEQARGESVDHRSDLFSMGSVLYTACTGRPAFRSEAAYGILRRITDTEPRPIRELNPEIPEWLCHVIERLMAKDAADRFQSAAEAGELLEGCLAHLQQPTVVDLPTAVRFAANQAEGPESDSNTAERGAVSAQQPTEVRKTAGSGHAVGLSSSSTTFTRRMIRVAIAAAAVATLALVSLQTTEPADISGHWTGETWKSVSLSTVANADGWYSGSFTDDRGRSGALQLEWSRLQRRYTGRWKSGDGAAGSLTLRSSADSIRGAIAVDADSPTQRDVPRLRDFLWKRGDASNRPVQMPATETATGGRRPGPALQTIESPVKGRIAGWGEGIREGARVEKGDLIAEIVDIDSGRIARLSDQRDAARDTITAAESGVVASTRNVEYLKAIVASYQSQLDAREEVMKQHSEASDARVTAAANNVNAQRAMVDEIQAALRQEEADYIRNKELFDEGILSEAKYQISERRAAERKASLQQAQAKLLAAENAVTEVRADEKAKEQQAIAEVESARIQLLKAESDLAKSESELARAESELSKANKGLLAAETQLARQESVLIVAPMAGSVNNLFAGSSTRIVKEGDVICVLHPDAEIPADAETKPVPKSDTGVPEAEAANSFDLRDLANIPGRSTATLSMADTIETAISLGQRFRRIYVQLPPDSPEDQNRNSQAAKDLMAAKRDRDTAIAILTAERDAVGRQNETQMAMRKAARQRVENGDLNPYSIYHHELNVLTSADALRRLDLLLNYYQKIGEGMTDADVDVKLTAETIRCYHDTAQNRLKILSELTEIARKMFELGENDLEAVTEAEQAEAAATTDFQTAKALLSRYAVDETATKEQESSDTEADLSTQP